MDEEQRAQVARKIRDAMRSRGWSQAALAEAAHVSENTVAGIVGGKVKTQQGKLRAVLDALGVVEPTDGIIALDGVPEDVRVFLTVAAKRLSLMGETRRTAVLADLYPRLLTD